MGLPHFLKEDAPSFCKTVQVYFLFLLPMPLLFCILYWFSKWVSKVCLCACNRLTYLQTHNAYLQYGMCRAYRRSVSNAQLWPWKDSIVYFGSQDKRFMNHMCFLLLKRNTIIVCLLVLGHRFWRGHDQGNGCWQPQGGRWSWRDRFWSGPRRKKSSFHPSTIFLKLWNCWWVCFTLWTSTIPNAWGTLLKWFRKSSWTLEVGSALRWFMVWETNF